MMKRTVSPGRILKATSAHEKVQEFKSNLDGVTKAFERALAATVYVSVMTAAEKAECVEISNWLTSLDFVGRLQDIIGHHTPGTGAWFLERDDIQDWMYDRSKLCKLWFTGPRKFFPDISNLVWLIKTSKAGCGKTMMA